MSELTEMEKYLQKLFTEAGQDLKKKFLKYTQDFQRLDAERQQAVEDGRMTEDEYKEWRKNKLLYGMHWQRLIDRDTKELLKYNRTALKYINGEVPQIFASGYNDVVEQVPDSPVAGYDFELVNADTVNNLVHEEGITLPRKVLDPEKDVAWNAKLINAQLLQGILQGESIPEMAKRMQTVANSDLAGATRTARTMHTAAQNYGRQTGYNKAAKQGIIFEKTWLAANNERTRLSHAMMSGQTVAYDAKFVSPVTGVKLNFPGDWSAEGANVGSEIYNCRCTMVTKFKGFMSLKDAENVGDGVKVKGWMPEDYTWKWQSAVTRMVNALEQASQSWSGVTDEERKAIIEAASNAPEHIASVIADTIANANIYFHDDPLPVAEGSFYDHHGNIHIVRNGRTPEEIVYTFWHEYGHFVDNAEVSKSGYKNILEAEARRLVQKPDGSITTETYTERTETNGITAMFAHFGMHQFDYQNAVASDLNDFFARNYISSRYELIVGEDEYSDQYLYIKYAKKKYDPLNPDYAVTETLKRELLKETNRLTGTTKAENYLYDNGCPRPFKWDIYLEQYTDESGIVQYKPRFEGALEEFDELRKEYEEKKNAFESRPDFDELIKTKEELTKQAEANRRKILYVTDTLDAGTKGAFMSIVTVGGHEPEYYATSANGIMETIANVFSCEVMQDEEYTKYMESLNPQVYKTVKEVLKNGRT